MTAADAAARLRYTAKVRQRTRRAAELPGWAMCTLGALIVARALLQRCLPNLQALSTVWLIAMIVLRPIALRWLSRQRQLRTGVIRSGRHTHTPLLAAAVIAILALALDPHLMVDAIAAALTVSALLSGRSATAAATAANGLITSALLLQGTPSWVALLLFGAGVISVGAVQRPRRAEA